MASDPETPGAGPAHLEVPLQELLDALPEGVLITDAGGVVRLANARMDALFGHGDELVGQPVEVLLPQPLRAAHKSHRQRWALGQPTREMEKRPGLVGVRKDGTQVPVDVALSRLRRGDQLFTVATIRDVRERRELEAQLHQAQKMESVGLLAGGLAHDFNNILTVICGCAHQLAEDLPEAGPHRADAKEILAAADHAAGLCRQLLAVSRKQPRTLVALSPNRVIDETRELLQRLVGKDIELVTQLAPGLGHLKADVGQLQQVLLNLAANARDAMPGGGTLTLSTAQQELEPGATLGGPSAKPGPYLVIAVRDTGLGIKAELLPRVFEPFFTTKEFGRGTGLGLAMVFSIVQQNQGFVHVESQEGRGSCFEVWLPRCDESPAPAPQPRPPPATLAGSETVLVVEDTEAVRLFATQVLSRNGYRVLAAASGAQALALSAAEPGRIALLLTDVVMPEMAGPELAARLTQQRPGLAVLLMSGFTAEELGRSGAVGAEALLQKPFTPTALLERVRSLLDGPGARRA